MNEAGGWTHHSLCFHFHHLFVFLPSSSHCVSTFIISLCFYLHHLFVFLPSSSLCVSTFIISLDMSLMVAWISGILIRACMDFMTSVLFSRAPAILSVAINRASLVNNQNLHNFYCKQSYICPVLFCPCSQRTASPSLKFAQKHCA